LITRNRKKAIPFEPYISMDAMPGNVKAACAQLASHPYKMTATSRGKEPAVGMVWARGAVLLWCDVLSLSFVVVY
jgi:hypothetical protein